MEVKNKSAIFIIERDLYYKFYSTIIDELLKRDFTIFLAHNYNSPRFSYQNKIFSFPDLSKSPNFSKQEKIHTFVFYNTKELIKKINSDNIEYVFSLHSRSFYLINKKIIPNSAWVTIQHWADNFTSEFLLRKNMLDCDYLCLYSEKWWNGFLNSRYSKNVIKKSPLPKIFFSGCPYHDSTLSLKKSLIKQKYGLSKSEKILLYIPLGFAGTIDSSISTRLWLNHSYNNGSKFYSSLISKGFKSSKKHSVTEIDLVKSIKEFCRKNNSLFIVKGRSKKPVSNEVKNLSDYVIYDETFHPSTLCEMIFISDLVISHYSMVIWEAINLGVYNINIGFNKIYDHQTKLYRELFNEDWKDDLSKKGLNKMEDPNSFMSSIKNKTFEDFGIEMSIKNEVAKKYFSQPPGKSTIHLVDSILNA